VFHLRTAFKASQSRNAKQHIVPYTMPVTT
jgi:hypothetical protein